MNRVGAILLLALIVGVAWFSYRAGYNYAHDLHMSEKAREWEGYNAAIRVAHQRELEQRDKAIKLESDKNAEIARLSANVDVLNRQLLNRAKRPEGLGVPETSTVEHNCTGRELYREDGKFLVGEAARADQAVILLKQCLAQYNAIGE